MKKIAWKQKRVWGGEKKECVEGIIGKREGCGGGCEGGDRL